MKRSLILMSAMAVFALFADDYYVDAAVGNDAYDGTSPTVKDGGTGPKKSIQAAVDLTQADHGDIVYVAEGEYREGGSGGFRVNGKAGVRIVASGERDKTFIIGEAHGEESYGCGANALKCVNLPSGAWLKGFTICGGRGAAFDSSAYGAGVVGVSPNSSFVVDCVISNCVSGRAAGVRNVTAIRCRFNGNRVSTTGSHIMGALAYNCYLNASLSNNKYDAYSSTLRNCTITSGSARDSKIYNSFVYDDRGNNVMNRCVYGKSSTSDPTIFENECVKSGAYTIDENVRPLNAVLALDKGDYVNYTNGVAEAVAEELELDYAKGQRVYNGAIDIGCGEYDCRADFAGKIGEAGAVSLLAVPPNATAGDDGRLNLASDSETKVVLSGSGDDGKAHIYRFAAETSGGAVLYVYLDGEAEPFQTVAAADGVKTVECSAAAGTVLRLVVSGEGEAKVGGFAKGNHYYVDADIGNDGYDGTSPTVKDGGVGPKKSIQAAVNLTKANHGDIVYVAEGEYREGGSHHYRVYGYGKDGVQIVASGNRDKTFIIGEADSAGSYGCGDNAYKCVYISSNSCLRGFTVCGGRGDQFASGGYGGGIRGISSNFSFVVDCVISNCVSGRGAGVLYVTAVCCRFYQNRVNSTGTDLMDSLACNCYLHGSLSTGRYDAYQSTLRNCTVAGTVRSSQVFNSYIGDDKGLCVLNRSVYKSIDDSSSSENQCVKSSGFSYDADIRPTNDALAIDKGDYANYTNGVAAAVAHELKCDYAKGRRVYNGAIDIGCGEYDWREEYSSAVDPRGRIQVVAASESVTLGQSTVVLNGKAEIATEWNLRYNEWCSFAVAVDGDGTVAVTVDGEVVEVVDGICRFRAAQGMHTVEISFAGAGSASLSQFIRGGMGTVVSVR